LDILWWHCNQRRGSSNTQQSHCGLEPLSVRVIADLLLMNQVFDCPCWSYTYWCSQIVHNKSTKHTKLQQTGDFPFYRSCTFQENRSLTSIKHSLRRKGKRQFPVLSSLPLILLHSLDWLPGIAESSNSPPSSPDFSSTSLSSYPSSVFSQKQSLSPDLTSILPRISSPLLNSTFWSFSHYLFV